MILDEKDEQPQYAVEYLIPSRILRYKANFKRFWKMYTESPFGLFGLALVSFFVIVACLAPVLAPYDPNASMTGNKYETMSLSHPLGTDRRGRDIFSQIIWGTQVSLAVGLLAAFIAVVIGTLVGLLAGYYGGILDNILMRFTDFFIQIPALPLILVFVIFFGGGINNLILVIGILGWTGTARMVRSETLSIKERSFIEATRAIGAKDRHIIFGHILPNIIPLISAQAILSVVDAIIAEAGISFLGFGSSEVWSWGRVLNEARRELAVLTGRWWYFVPPGLFIMLLALGFALISYSLNEVLNPRLRKK